VPYLETALGGIWWIVGAVALGGGLNTVVLAAGIGVVAALVVALRQRYGGGEPLASGRRGRLLRLIVGSLVAIAVSAAGLGYLGYAELSIPVACAVVGVALVMASSVLDARTLVAAGSVMLVLGAVGAVLALGSAGPLYPHGLVGLGAGAALWLFGAQRTGLLAEVRGRTRR
jgi:hypothetical protein